MSTTTFVGARFVAAAFDPDPTHPVIEARLRRAEAHARPFLARLAERDLRVLGFTPVEIAALRTSALETELVKL